MMILQNEVDGRTELWGKIAEFILEKFEKMEKAQLKDFAAGTGLSPHGSGEDAELTATVLGCSNSRRKSRRGRPVLQQQC